MTDPYVVLGLSPNASEEEVKKAYKKMAKKYHPDVTGNDPAAAKKMQEVNAAYDAIINKKTDYGYGQSSSGYNSYSSGFNSSYGFGGYSSGYREESDYGDYPNEMKAAVNYINARRYNEALTALSGVPFDKRTGRWYYLSAVAKSYSGDTDGAKEDINVAIFKEPTNYSYQAFKERLYNSRNTYQYYQKTYTPSSSNAFLSCCLPTILLNLFCNCCF